MRNQPTPSSNGFWHLKFLWMLVLGVWSFAIGTAPAASGADRRPNILFIIADQWRPQAFGFAGDPNVKTPNLDRFERESFNFTQAVAGTPVCSPTRASLLTGQRPLTHGVFLNDVPLTTNAVTLAKVLRAAGYETACIGKWHIDGHGRSNFIPTERRQGFAYWKALECRHAGESFARRRLRNRLHRQVAHRRTRTFQFYSDRTPAGFRLLESARMHACLQ